MHRSIFSDPSLFDRFDDSGVPAPSSAISGRAHRDGLIRGLALMAIVGVVIGLAMVSGAVHSADADPAPFAQGRIPVSVTDWIAEHRGTRALLPASSLQRTSLRH